MENPNALYGQLNILKISTSYMQIRHKMTRNVMLKIKAAWMRLEQRQGCMRQEVGSKHLLLWEQCDLPGWIRKPVSLMQ